MMRYWKQVRVVTVLSLALVSVAQAGDLKITIPKRSSLTPVQRLNREGVEAVQKGQIREGPGTVFPGLSD